MLNELLAKATAREKLIVYGAVAVVLGVVVGMILASKSYGGYAGFPGVSVNYFTAGTAGSLAILALLAALASLAVVYNHVAPKPVVATLPAPYGQILIGVAGATAALAVLTLLFQLIRDGGLGPEPPIFLYVADILVVGGGVVAGFAAYQEWMATKAA